MPSKELLQTLNVSFKNMKQTNSKSCSKKIANTTKIFCFR